GVPEERRDVAELGMDGRAVEALGEVLEEELPVRLHVHDDALADAEIGEAVVPEALRQVTQGLVKRRGAVPREVDEDEAAPGGDGHLEEGVGRLVEVRALHLPRGADELPVEAVGPRVIRADQAPAGEAALLLGAEDRAAMTAGVVERLEPALEIP